MIAARVLVVVALALGAAARLEAQEVDAAPAAIAERFIITAESAEHRATHLALGAYLTAAFLDASETSYCYGRGSCFEANPVLRPIAERSHVVTAMAVKGAMHAGISAAILKLHRQHPRAATWITLGLTSVQVAVDVVNVRRGALR